MNTDIIKTEIDFMLHYRCLTMLRIIYDESHFTFNFIVVILQFPALSSTSAHHTHVWVKLSLFANSSADLDSITM